MSSIAEFFRSGSFMPHGMCYLWKPEILWLHVASDSLIAASYFTIPAGLFFLVRRRDDLEFKWLFLLFTSFILLCGLTHVLNVVIVWNPLYGPEGLMKLVTGVVSGITAIALWKLLPTAATIPGPAHYRAINADLSEQVQLRSAAEQRLRDLNETLEAQVQRRTMELEQANRNLEDFAYIASHDLRAPLTSVAQLVSAIEEDLPDQLEETSVDYLAMVKSRVERMQTMLEDILAYSRAGRIDSPPEQVDCNALLSEIATWVAPPAGLSITAATELPTLTIEKSVLEQIFLNLISNAIKHHDRSEGTVSVSYERTPDSHEFTFRDDGPGIPPHYHERITKMFQTLKSRDEVEGSGIGLAIVQKLVHSKGGSLAIRSPLNGRGSAFIVTLPASGGVQHNV